MSKWIIISVFFTFNVFGFFSIEQKDIIVEWPKIESKIVNVTKSHKDKKIKIQFEYFEGYEDMYMVPVAKVGESAILHVNTDGSFSIPPIKLKKSGRVPTKKKSGIIIEPYAWIEGVPKKLSLAGWGLGFGTKNYFPWSKYKNVIDEFYLVDPQGIVDSVFIETPHGNTFKEYLNEILKGINLLGNTVYKADIKFTHEYFRVKGERFWFNKLDRGGCTNLASFNACLGGNETIPTTNKFEISFLQHVVSGYPRPYKQNAQKYLDQLSDEHGMKLSAKLSLYNTKTGFRDCSVQLMKITHKKAADLRSLVLMEHTYRFKTVEEVVSKIKTSSRCDRLKR